MKTFEIDTLGETVGLSSIMSTTEELCLQAYRSVHKEDPDHMYFYVQNTWIEKSKKDEDEIRYKRTELWFAPIPNIDNPVDEELLRRYGSS